MSLQKLISNYASFNEWANHKIVVWLKELDPSLLYKTTPSSFTSIDYTLQHILRTQRFWLSFISEEDTTHFDWRVIEGNIERIFSELEEVSQNMKVKFSLFNEDELMKTLVLNMSWCKNNLNRYEYILHVINHSTFHRGQIITMARCLGINEGVVNTDYNFFNTK